MTDSLPIGTPVVVTFCDMTDTGCVAEYRLEATNLWRGDVGYCIQIALHGKLTGTRCWTKRHAVSQCANCESYYMSGNVMNPDTIEVDYLCKMCRDD